MQLKAILWRINRIEDPINARYSVVDKEQKRSTCWALDTRNATQPTYTHTANK